MINRFSPGRCGCDCGEGSCVLCRVRFTIVCNDLAVVGATVTIWVKDTGEGGGGGEYVLCTGETDESGEWECEGSFCGASRSIERVEIEAVGYPDIHLSPWVFAAALQFVSSSPCYDTTTPPRLCRCDLYTITLNLCAPCEDVPCSPPLPSPPNGPYLLDPFGNVITLGPVPGVGNLVGCWSYPAAVTLNMCDEIAGTYPCEAGPQAGIVPVIYIVEYNGGFCADVVVLAPYAYRALQGLNTPGGKIRETTCATSPRCVDPTTLSNRFPGYLICNSERYLASEISCADILATIQLGGTCGLSGPANVRKFSATCPPGSATAGAAYCWGMGTWISSFQSLDCGGTYCQIDMQVLFDPMSGFCYVNEIVDLGPLGGLVNYCVQGTQTDDPITQIFGGSATFTFVGCGAGAFVP